MQRGKREEKQVGSAIQIVKELLRQHRPAIVPGLPPFTAGAVGYFSYDAVRQLENIGEHAKDDLSLPDCVLMFFDRLLAFDHLRHQIHIIANADVREKVRDGHTTVRLLTSGFWKRNWRRAFDPGTGTGVSKKLAGKLKIHAGTTRMRFIDSVEHAKRYIAAGDIFQVVLSQRLDFTPEVAPFDVYRALRAVNPSPYLYFLRMGDTHVLG